MGTHKVLIDYGNKKLLEGETEDQLIQSFTDNILSRDGKKTGRVKGKGVLNNAISTYIFEYLESYHVATYFSERLNDREMLVKRVKSIPVDVVVRNIATGSTARQFGLKDRTELESPFIEYYYNAEFGKYPLINESHIHALNLAESDDIRNMSMEITKSNAVLKPFFERRNIKLVEFMIQFGVYNGKVVIAGEFNPDTCRLWDAETNEILDRDRFTRNGDKISRVYREVYDRLIGMG